MPDQSQDPKKLKAMRAMMDPSPDIQVQQVRDRIREIEAKNQVQHFLILGALEDALLRLKANKPEERSEEARQYAIVITDLEKVIAYFWTWFLAPRARLTNAASKMPGEVLDE